MKKINSILEGITSLLTTRRVNKVIANVNSAYKENSNWDKKRAEMHATLRNSISYLKGDGIIMLLNYYSKNLLSFELAIYGFIIEQIEILIDRLPEEERDPTLILIIQKNKNERYLDGFADLIIKMNEPYKTIYLNEYIRKNTEKHSVYNINFVEKLIERIKRPLTEEEIEITLKQVISKGNLDVASKICDKFIGRSLTDEELITIINYNNQNSSNTCCADINIAIKALDLIKVEQTKAIQKEKILERCLQFIRTYANTESAKHLDFFLLNISK